MEDGGRRLRLGRLEGIRPGAHIHLVPFKSKRERLAEQNNEFFLRCTIPDPRDGNSNGAFRSVIVMINGLAEADVRPYDELAAEFAEHGVPSILLPLPNHLVRHCTSPERDRLYPPPFDDHQDPYALIPERQDDRGRAFKAVTRHFVDRLAADPTVWMDGFAQTMSDIEQVLDLVHMGAEGRGGFFKDHFNADTEVSLYGYSLGGLMALSAVLLWDKRIKSCFAVNSGSSLEEIDASSLFKGPGRWHGIQLELISAYEDCSRQGPVPYGSVYEKVILGLSPKLRQEFLRRVCRRVLFVLGATDEIFRLSEVVRLAASRTGIAVFQVPGTGHWIGIDSFDKPEWDRWRPFLVRMLLSFARHHPSDDAYQEELEIAAREIRARCGGEKVRGKLMLWNRKSERLTPVSATKNIAETEEAAAEYARGNGFSMHLFEDALKLPQDDPKAMQLVQTRSLGELTKEEVASLGYSEEDLKCLSKWGVKTVCAAPIWQLDEPEGGGPRVRTCVGVVAFATDAAISVSNIGNQECMGLVSACAVVIARQLRREGGVEAAILDRERSQRWRL